MPGEVREDVGDDRVVSGPEGQAHAVLAALDEVVLEDDVERLEGGQAGVLSLLVVVSLGEEKGV